MTVQVVGRLQQVGVGQGIGIVVVGIAQDGPGVMRCLLGIGGVLFDGQALTLLGQQGGTGLIGQDNGVVEKLTEDVEGLIPERLL